MLNGGCLNCECTKYDYNMNNTIDENGKVSKGVAYFKAAATGATFCVTHILGDNRCDCGHLKS